MVTKTLSLVLVSMVSEIWLTRRLTMPATESKIGQLPVEAGIGDAQKLAEAGDDGDLAVLTVKKLLSKTIRTKRAITPRKIRPVGSIQCLRCRYFEATENYTRAQLRCDVRRIGPQESETPFASWRTVHGANFRSQALPGAKNLQKSSCAWADK